MGHDIQVSSDLCAAVAAAQQPLLQPAPERHCRDAADSAATPTVATAAAAAVAGSSCDFANCNTYCGNPNLGSCASPHFQLKLASVLHIVNSTKKSFKRPATSACHCTLMSVLVRD